MPLPAGSRARVVFEPEKGLDLGNGRGRALECEVAGGVVGVLLDARGRRPFRLPGDPARRVEALRRWNAALDVYPEAADSAGRS